MDWSTIEIEYIKNKYIRKSLRQIAIDLNRSYYSVRGMSALLKLSRLKYYNKIDIYPFEFGNIMGHLDGDGHIGKKSIYYSNTSKELINNFISCYKKVFPNLSYSMHIVPEGTQITLPRTGSYLTERKLYKVHVSLKLKKFINTKYYNNSNFIKGYLQSIFDDEASSDQKQKRIVFYQKEGEVIQRVGAFLEKIGIAYVKGFTKRDNICHIDIRREKNLRFFRNLINFNHPLKREKLNNIFNEYSHHFNYRHETQDIILKLLEKNKHLKRKKLARLLRISERQTQSHVTEMINKKLIVSDKSKGTKSLGYSLK